MRRRWIKVRSVRPRQGAHFGIGHDGIEQIELLERPEQGAFQPWQATAETLNRIAREDGGRPLVVRMKMRAMKRLANFYRHSNYDSEEPRNLRHRLVS